MVARMKASHFVVAAAILAGCASAPVSAVSTPAPSSSPGATPSRAAALLSHAGAADAPTRAEIERVLGAPDVARNDGAGAMLTYRRQSCALFLVFTSDQRNAMRLREAHVEARRQSQAAPSVDRCAAEAAAER